MKLIRNGKRRKVRNPKINAVDLVVCKVEVINYNLLKIIRLLNYYETVNCVSL